MRKIQTALLAGAVVVGLGAVASLAAFAPSFVAQKTHEMTWQLPGGGSETIAYTGKTAPRVKFHTGGWQGFWTTSSDNWGIPNFAALDPFLPAMNSDLELLASTPWLLSPTDPQLTAATLGALPAGTSYSMMSETFGNGVCTRFTQITKGYGDATPKIVSHNQGDCGSQTNQAELSHGSNSSEPVKLSIEPQLAKTQSM